MWNHLPFDLLANIFSYLPPDSLARAKAACRSWRATANTAALATRRHHHPPWFVVLPTRTRGPFCYIHSPIGMNWHALPFDYITSPIRPIATIGGLILMKITSTNHLELIICNIFTRQFRALPMLNVTRTNPAVGLVENNSCQRFGFKIYVAGGVSKAASGGGGTIYQSTIEMYDSDRDTWRIIGPMPVEFAVRLTVWTPNESVYSNGTLYWMTSARAYSVMGFEIETNRWRELSAPMADRLRFAALVPRNGCPTIVGGMCGGDGWIWELGEGGVWNQVEKLPIELGIKLLGDKLDWGSVKCVGINGTICLYREIGSGIIIWKEVFGGKWEWEWEWIEGCCAIKGREIHNIPIKGLLIHPNISHCSYIF